MKGRSERIAGLPLAHTGQQIRQHKTTGKRSGMLTEYLYGWSKQRLVDSSGLGFGVRQSSLLLSALLSLLLK